MKIFKNNYEHLFTNCFEISTLPGWDVLLTELCDKVDNFIKNNSNDIKTFSFVQIKEKFGYMRVYFDLECNDDVDNIQYDKIYKQLIHLVDQAEYKAQFICEVCGEPGQLRTLSWLKTLCDDHHIQFLSKNTKF